MSVVIKEDQPLSIQLRDLSPEYAEIMVLGSILYKSGYFKDVRDQAQAVTKILCGRELGFSPIVSLQGIHIIEGKPALSSNLMATLIKRSGKYDYRVKFWDHGSCVLTFREKCDGKWEEIGTSQFTIDDAKAAGLVRQGGSWSKFPKALLFARALSQGMRTYCPDVSAAPIYNPEEMGAEVNQDGDVTQLPKSARPIEVTTRDIPITPLKPSAPANNGQDGNKPQKGKKPSDGAETHSTAESVVVNPDSDDKRKSAPAVELPPIESTLVKQAEANVSPKPGTLPADHIEDGQASNFERMFKDALKPQLRKRATELSHAWLEKQDIVDGNGEPTAKAILKQNFYEVREAAIDYATSLQV